MERRFGLAGFRRSAAAPILAGVLLSTVSVRALSQVPARPSGGPPPAVGVWYWHGYRDAPDFLVPILRSVGSQVDVVAVNINGGEDAVRRVVPQLRAALPERVELVIGLVTADHIPGPTPWYDHLDAWRQLGDFVPIVQRMSRAERVLIDVEYQLAGYVNESKPLDLGRLSACLQAFQARIRGATILWYPPVFQWDQAQRAKVTQVMSAAAAAIRRVQFFEHYCNNKEAVGMYPSVYSRELARSLSWPLTTIQQVYVLGRPGEYTLADFPQVLRDAITETWFYFEPPYTTASATACANAVQRARDSVRPTSQPAGQPARR